MSDTQETAPPPRRRRRRSDARRSIDAILDAARVVLGERPDASMEEIAVTAGVTRQTVYAHFPSRDALLVGLVEAASAEYDAMLDDVGLDTAPPADALAGFLDVGWRFMDRYPVVLSQLNPSAPRIPRPENDPHDVVPPRLERVIQRGQQEGDFDASLPAAWLTAAVFGLQHTAAEQVVTGRMGSEEAAAVCLESSLRLCGGRRGGPAS